MNNVQVFDDFVDVKNNVVRLDLNVFILLQGIDYGHIYGKTLKRAYRTLYRTNLTADNDEFLIRKEGVELEYLNTDFGLLEVILIKLK